MDGFVQGPEAVRAVLVSIRGLYDYQTFNFACLYGENDWLEDYTAGVERQANRQLHGGQAQRCWAGGAHRGQLPAPQHDAALVPAGRRAPQPTPPTESTSSPARRETDIPTTTQLRYHAQARRASKMRTVKQYHL